MMSLGVKENLKDKRVVEIIIKEDGLWNEELIREALRKTRHKDEIVWGKDSKGLFFVKNVYHLASQLGNQDNASGSDGAKEKRIWKSTWSLECQLRVKITVWKIVKNTLPTIENIEKRGVHSNELCFSCREKKEDEEHTFWRCKVSRRIWGMFIPNLTQLFSMCRD